MGFKQSSLAGGWASPPLRECQNMDIISKGLRRVTKHAATTNDHDKTNVAWLVKRKKLVLLVCIN